MDICCCHILIVDRHPVLIDNGQCPAATLEKGWSSRKKWKPCWLHLHFLEVGAIIKQCSFTSMADRLHWRFSRQSRPKAEEFKLSISCGKCRIYIVIITTRREVWEILFQSEKLNSQEFDTNYIKNTIHLNI